MRYTDPSGHWFESLFDIASIGYDIYDITTNGLNWENGLSLAADIGSLLLPVVTGGGLMVRAAAHADDVVDAARAVNAIGNVGQAANDAGNITQAANQITNGVEAVQSANTTTSNLYAFGNRAGPRAPRPGYDIFPDSLGNIGPEFPPFPNGASTFADPNMAPLTGPYHVLPSGTNLPEGLNVLADGMDVNPISPHPPTHHTIYPSNTMHYNDFTNLFRNLPWQYAGRK